VYASATAFSVMKAAGALYLIYLGLKMLLSRAGGPEADRFRDDRSAVFRQAFLTSLSNPKVAVFFLAFLPQFVSPQAGCPPVSILFLGGVLIGTGTIWSLFLVAVSASATNALRGRRRASVYLNRALGALLVGLGIRLAVTTR
jgi:threonine/homoserine/homoserine lactone efflux protein